ncbi:hypothetical protein [uncultured Ruminococcus sp.]|uniref:hypothetical protein n=1 Tax=uncultured Ruminococcus sp. TaxID=165186 RepID=UPI00261CACB9|nr:hypothetical protein [uncultured Ruminococcus sp.]
MDKLATIYIMFNVIYSTLFIIFVCGNEAFMTPWWVTLIAAIVPAVLTLIGSLTLSRRSQLRKNTEEIQKLARQLGVNDEKTFHAEFSEQYNKIMDNIGKTPNDKALTGQHQDMLKILQRDFQIINGRYEKEDESYRSFTMQQKNLKETLDNFSRDYAKIISENGKLFNENIVLKDINRKLEAENKQLRSELENSRELSRGNSLHM